MHPLKYFPTPRQYNREKGMKERTRWYTTQKKKVIVLVYYFFVKHFFSSLYANLSTFQFQCSIALKTLILFLDAKK